MPKAKVLFFDSNNEARLMNMKVEDGSIMIGDKQFIVDTAHPLHLKTLLGFRPMYLIKWNNVTPATNVNMERINPEFKDKYPDITPEMLRKLMGLKILGNLIKVKKQTGGIIFLIVGIIVGLLILYGLIIMKVIHL